ncbi:MAG: hypothetical protein KIY12_09115 [Thermoplasmata archaeon]|uniref:Uncharacterized protein n=1 Tax=Candidatus Sysuiplasma superficiale TaxID=2823368 RepID=A0A8J8CDS3_9ARCH|nr:hypothetical protein [Candidatus Sysuiplasma superficiale]
MQIVIRRDIEAPAESFFAWWTDYSESDSVRNRYMSVTRRMVSRSLNEAVMEDTFSWPLHMTDRVHAFIGRNSVSFTSVSRVWTVEGKYSFEASGGTCLFEGKINIRPRGIWKLVLNLPPARIWMRRGIAKDTEEHIDEFLSCWKRRQNGQGERGRY